jgi:hypothetical protein
MTKLTCSRHGRSMLVGPIKSCMTTWKLVDPNTPKKVYSTTEV